MYGVGYDCHPGPRGEHAAIDLSVLCQLSAVGGHGGVETQALFDAVLQVGQLPQVIPMATKRGCVL